MMIMRWFTQPFDDVVCASGSVTVCVGGVTVCVGVGVTVVVGVTWVVVTRCGDAFCFRVNVTAIERPFFPTTADIPTKAPPPRSGERPAARDRARSSRSRRPS
jgi:hypothetical protein